METMYFVTYFRRNGSTKAWAYKVELGTKSIDEAKKKFHALMGEYIGGDTFDFVTVSLTDMFGNVIQSENWEAQEA